MQLTQAERANGRLAPDTLTSAIQQVRNNGYTILEEALPQPLLEELRGAFAPLLEAHVAQVGADYNRPKLQSLNHYSIYLPFAPPFSDERIVANPLVQPLLEALIGPEGVCHYFASNIAMPGSNYQDTHADAASLFPETMPVLPPYSIVINLPLVDFREDNGPLEVWPGGTHHHVATAAEIPVLAEGMHAELVLMRAGSILIRDARLWHRGTPNRSNAPRPMLALVCSRSWLKLQRPPIEIPRRAYEKLSPWGQKLFRLEAIGA